MFGAASGIARQHVEQDRSPGRWPAHCEVGRHGTPQTCVREIADDLSVMMDEPALRSRSLYSRLMAAWTEEAAQLPGPDAGGCTVRFGVPSYEDDEPRHDPDTETVETAVRGIRAGASATRAKP